MFLKSGLDGVLGGNWVTVSGGGRHRGMEEREDGEFFSEWLDYIREVAVKKKCMVKFHPPESPPRPQPRVWRNATDR